MKYVQDFDRLDRKALPQVGGKNANLGELIQSGIRVPPGFSVSVDAYLRFIDSAGIGERIAGLLEQVNTDDSASLEGRSKEIRDFILEGTMPADVAGEIEARYEYLCSLCDVEDLPVATRSSATAEDLPDASFAGQQDTYLWVQGTESVVEHVQRCWSSLFTARAVSYRVRNKFPHDKALISVGVQKMVNAKAAGVMFTLDPGTGDPSQVVLEGNWGLGETVAAGEVTPDYFRLDKISMEINDKRISHKHVECVPVPEEKTAQMVPVPEDRSDESCVERPELEELVRVARLIESHYGTPQDIEWAIDKDLPFPENVFVVQARPETVWSRRKPESKLAGRSAEDLLMARALRTIKVK